MTEPVTVIGAGFAGLAAARKLRQRGMEVSILEARDRVGGRVWSEQLGNGIVFERGGEFVMENYELLPAISAELGLQLASHGAPFADREVREPGAPTREQLLRAAHRLGEHIQQLLESATSPISLADAVSSSPLSSAEKRIIAARLSGTITTDIANVDLAWVGATSAHDGSVGFEIPRYVVGGNQRIATAIAEDLGGSVRLNSPVAALEQTAKGVLATLSDGAVVAGDAAIVAVPPALVRELDFTPQMPPAQAQAYDSIGFGVSSKLTVALKATVPPAVMQEITAPFSIFASSRPDGGDPLTITCFSGSQAGQAHLGLGGGDPSKWLAALCAVRPELEPDGNPVLTEWGLERWTQGAYSYRPLGWSQSAEDQLRSPLGRIAFAGEHTAGVDFAATMEGALRSGERAAADVVACLAELPAHPQSIAAETAG